MAYKSSFGSRREASLTRRLVPWLGISAIIVLSDQLCKIAIRHRLGLAERISVLPVFDLTLLFNRGAAFSLLDSDGPGPRWLFTGFGLLAAVFIISLLARHGRQRLFAFSLALILGGTLGNVIDRLVSGHVTDFLLLHYSSYYFPAFNLADSAITVGAVLLVIDELRRVGQS